LQHKTFARVCEEWQANLRVQPAFRAKSLFRRQVSTEGCGRRRVIALVTVAAELPYRTAECRSIEIEHGAGISSSRSTLNFRAVSRP
jgi:hypothetical protein